MHAPNHYEIVDDLLIYDEDCTERGRYEDEEEVRCHHLRINAVGGQLPVRHDALKCGRSEEQTQ